MHIAFLSVIPEVFDPYLSASILGRAREAGIVSFSTHDLRDWTHDRHRTVDDAPFGGGAGMLMKPEPIFEAVRDLRAHLESVPRVVFMAPHGEPFTQDVARRLAREPSLLLVCGRYEGMDERTYALADEVISIGDYVLTGGELPAMAVADACVRLLPGALGNDDSASDESFEGGLLECAQYTRPAVFEGMAVPEVLLSGDHGKVAEWRRENALERTRALRPDLLERAKAADGTSGGEVARGRA